MTMHISYVDNVLSQEARKAQSPKDALTQGTEYSMTLKNVAAQPWTFYVYQKLPTQVADVFSLAWFCSPYAIRVGDQIRFTWQIDYNFVWSDSGHLIPGVDFYASGSKDCSPAGDNTTEFSLAPGPGLSDSVQGPPAGSLVINDAADVPNNRYSVGIGMSGAGSYAVQAGTNLTHTFTPTPSYWIAAGTNVKVGTVLNINTVGMTSEVKFPAAVYDMNCVLTGTNSWNIKPA